MKRIAEELADEAERLRRQVVHATRPRGPLSAAEAAELAQRCSTRQATNMVRVTATHFCAGVVLDGRDLVVRGAPILRYMIGWSRARVIAYAARKGWRVEEL